MAAKIAAEEAAEVAIPIPSPDRIVIQTIMANLMSA